MISNPIIELESLQTKTIEILSLDELSKKYNELSSERQSEILFGLITIYKEHPTHLNISGASVNIKYQGNNINIDSFFQGNRLKIYNLPLDAIKDFIFMK